MVVPVIQNKRNLFSVVDEGLPTAYMIPLINEFLVAGIIAEKDVFLSMEVRAQSYSRPLIRAERLLILPYL